MEYRSFYSEVDETRSLKAYFGDIGKISLLTPEEEKQLARRVRAGDRVASRRLAEANLRFVVSIAKNYRNRGMPLPDLINEGNVGLMKAVAHFDPDRGVRFISYAVWWIRQSITEALQENRSLVHIPANRVEDANRLNRAEALLAQKLGHEPSTVELGRELRLSHDQIGRRQGDAPMFSSLEAPIGGGDEDRTVSEILQDPEAPPIDSLVALSELRSDVTEVLGDLPPKERRIIEMRFGLKGSLPMTLQQAGHRMGLSRERVRQLENRALSRLRRPGTRGMKLEEYMH